MGLNIEINQRRIINLILLFAILGILVELFSPIFVLNVGCLRDKVTGKILQFSIYALMLFVGLRIRKKIT